ncbi:GTP-binding protein [Deltaproteobacteria bacterium OttesenSCG-928-K17]|nr:GTP-binding protein [Deltaproteobacteria bacterium OttesenSCG-928-K17]
MINKKICMLGSLAVGKTALVQQFVRSIFSDSYLSSVGVKISKKSLIMDDGETVNLLLWDLEGQDDYNAVNTSYIKGANGLFFVADGTRGETLSVALMLRNTALDILGQDIPHILIVNKEDISATWEITDKVLDSLASSGITVIKTSAKTGNNVENIFHTLAKAMMEKHQ